MNRFRFSSAAIAVAMMLASATGASANTLYFQMNPNLSGSNDQRQVFLFGPAGATGTVTSPNGFNQSFDLGTEGFAVVQLNLSDQLADAQVENKGFKVTSSAAVSGYYLSRRQATTDMSYLIDGERLGTNYLVAGYQNIYEDQMSVQATQDATTVTFTPKGGSPFQVTLNAGQTYMHTANSQLTGSSILADKPVAVFSGNRCTNVPTGITACDHLVEQMPSIDQLSSSYLLAQTPRTGTAGNVVRVVATADNTEVRVNGTLVATLASKGDFYEGRVIGGVQLEATNPVLVAQYLIGQSQAGANTDPAMTIVPGSDQWLSSYVFATPSGTADFPTDFVSIVIQTGSLGSLTVDGVVADASLFNPLGSTLYSYGNIDVSSTTGPFAISADTPFQLLLSGFDSFDSYFTYGGAAFSPGASPPPDDTPPPPPPPNTDVFWDGDGVGSANNNAVDGGTGTLTADSVNLTLENGATNNTLPDGPATVVFRGTPGTVTVDDVNGPLTFAGLRFLVDGYRIVGDAVALGGSAPTIQVGTDDDATALFSATVDALLTGTAGLRKAGRGTLVLTAANSYGGGTSVNQGMLVGNAATFGTGAITIATDAQLIMDQATNASFGQGVAGSGSFIKQGAGTLILTGTNGLSGGTFVTGGLLQVDGVLDDSAVTVRTGGLLGGNGSVGATLIQTGGRLGPGASIGTLNVVGNFNQATGSFYDVELNATGASDLLQATGTATIEPGATITVTKLDAAPHVLGTRYTVLTAAGGRSGTYAGLTGQTQVSAFVGIVPAYDANNVYLDVARNRAFAAAGATPNQIAAATGVDNAGNGALYTAIAMLPNDAAAQAAFDRISGEVHASARGATFEDSRFVREAMVNRTTGTREPGKGLWFQGYGSWGSFDGDGNAADVSRDIAGFFLGGEMVSDSGLILGAVTGYGEANLSVDDRLSDADTSDAYLGGYVGFNAAGFTVRGGLAYIWRDVKTVRRVAIPGFTDTLTAKYDLNTFQMFADAGYQMNLGPVALEPFIQLAYVDIGNGGFSERGGAAALDGSGGADFWLTQLGTRFELGLGGGGLNLRGSLGWRHTAGGDRTTPVSMGFAAGPVFDIAGAPVAWDSAAMSLAIAGKLSKNMEIDAGYSGVAGSGLSDHGVRAALTFRF
jgi:outer membrane autotransporter protein